MGVSWSGQEETHIPSAHIPLASTEWQGIPDPGDMGRRGEWIRETSQQSLQQWPMSEGVFTIKLT